VALATQAAVSVAISLPAASRCFGPPAFFLRLSWEY